jgi:hypothetical protein
MSRHLHPLDFRGCSPEKVPNQQEQRVERSQVPHPCGSVLCKGGDFVFGGQKHFESCCTEVRLRSASLCEVNGILIRE